MSRPDLILASGSAARISMLKKAGYDFETCPADIDENALRENFKGDSPQDIALKLAQEKALHISAQKENALVIGSDQICALEKQIFSKAKDEQEAFEKIKGLQGQTHALHSAAALYKEGQEIWSVCDTVFLTMKKLEDDQIKNYLNQAGDAPTACAGAYAIEEIGARLFDKIEGDYFTVLGLPLLPLIAALEQEGFTL